MSNMNTQQMARPYLPELESVDSNEHSFLGLTMLLLVVVSIALAAVTTYVYAVVKNALGLGYPGWQEWLPVAVGLFLFIGVGLSCTSWCHYRMRTDAGGITFGGLLSTRSVPWSDISKMSVVYGDNSYAYCKVTAGKKDFVVGAWGPRSAVLVASVWQHLSRRGVATEDDLPVIAKSLWTPIPDAIPQEMDWHNPKPIDFETAVAEAAMIGFVLLLGVYAVYRLGYMEKLVEHGYHVTTVIVGGLVGLFHSRFQGARSISVGLDRLHARTLLGRVDVPWFEVKSAQIVKDSLVINCGGVRGTVRVRYDVDSDCDVQLVLAIIRRLRLSPKPVPVVIPPPLGSTRYLSDY